MADYFALLKEPRRPWLDAERLKEAFLALSSEVHPDRVHNAPEPERKAANERYSELNAAYLCLREPKERLQHLLELERGAKISEVRQIPADTMSFFMETAQLLRSVESFLAKKAQITSPLLKAQSFQEGMAWFDRLDALQKKISAQQTTLENDLVALNAAWELAPPVGDPGRAAALPLAELEAIYQQLSFGRKWNMQLQEKLFQLST